MWVKAPRIWKWLCPPVPFALKYVWPERRRRESKNQQNPSDRKTHMLHYFLSGVHVCQASTEYQPSHPCGKIKSARKKNLLETCDALQTHNSWNKGLFPTSTTFIVGSFTWCHYSFTIQGKFIGHPALSLCRPFFLQLPRWQAAMFRRTWRPGRVAGTQIFEQLIRREIWSCGLPKQCTIEREILQNYQTFALFDPPQMSNLVITE